MERHLYIVSGCNDAGKTTVPVAANLVNPQAMGRRNFSSDKQSLADIKSLKWSIGCKHPNTQTAVDENIHRD